MFVCYTHVIIGVMLSMPSATILYCAIAMLASQVVCTADHRLWHVHRHGVHRSDETAPSCAFLTTINATNNFFHIHHCTADRTFLFHTEQPTRPSFLVRIVGPHTLYSGLSRQLDDHTHAFVYTVRHSGEHHVFIRVLLEDTPRESLADTCMSKLPSTNHTFIVEDEPQSGEPHNRVDTDDYCCWQSSKNLTDNWAEFDDVSSNADTMRQRYNDLTFTSSQLLPDPMLSDCLTNTTVCMYGDSQTRNLVDSIESYVASHDLANTTFVYTTLRYPGNLTEALNTTQSAQCTHSLFNFGQWPLGWVTNPPWTLAQLEQELADFLERIQSVPGYVYWVSTNPFPRTHYRFNVCPHLDWRVLTYIDLYNEAAKAKVAQHASVRYIETFRAMLHLHDFTFDGAHYQEPVGPGVAQLVLSQLCKPVNFRI